MLETIDIIRCRECISYVSYCDMLKDPYYSSYENILCMDGFCQNIDKWMNGDDFCSSGLKNGDVGIDG